MAQYRTTCCVTQLKKEKTEGHSTAGDAVQMEPSISPWHSQTRTHRCTHARKLHTIREAHLPWKQGLHIAPVSAASKDLKGQGRKRLSLHTHKLQTSQRWGRHPSKSGFTCSAHFLSCSWTCDPPSLQHSLAEERSTRKKFHILLDVFSQTGNKSPCMTCATLQKFGTFSPQVELIQPMNNCCLTLSPLSLKLSKNLPLKCLGVKMSHTEVVHVLCFNISFHMSQRWKANWGFTKKITESV